MAQRKLMVASDRAAGITEEETLYGQRRGMWYLKSIEKILNISLADWIINRR